MMSVSSSRSLSMEISPKISYSPSKTNGTPPFFSAVSNSRFAPRALSNISCDLRRSAAFISFILAVFSGVNLNCASSAALRARSRRRPPFISICSLLFIIWSLQGLYDSAAFAGMQKHALAFRNIRVRIRFNQNAVSRIFDFAAKRHSRGKIGVEHIS